LLGRAVRVREGGDLTLISTGAMLKTAVCVADRLAERGFRARVLSMHTLKPLDTEAILDAARETGFVITVEEHSILGGLGGAVAEILCESDIRRVTFRRIGLPSRFGKIVGDQDYLRKCYGLDEDSIYRHVLELLEKNSVVGEPSLPLRRAA
jgi:transketolase